MTRILGLLLPGTLFFQTTLAVVNPSTGDNNIVGIALIAGGVALVLLVLMLVMGKKKK